MVCMVTGKAEYQVLPAVCVCVCMCVCACVRACVCVCVCVTFVNYVYIFYLTVLWTAKRVECYSMPCFTSFIGAAATAYIMTVWWCTTAINAASKFTSALHYAKLVPCYQFAAITESPVSVTVLVGTNAQFSCAGAGFTIVWEVNKSLSTDPIIEKRGITSDTATLPFSDTVRSNLTVPATSENNGTIVRCRIVSILGLAFSNNSSLTILPGNWV